MVVVVVGGEVVQKVFYSPTSTRLYAKSSIPPLMVYGVGRYKGGIAVCINFSLDPLPNLSDI